MLLRQEDVCFGGGVEAPWGYPVAGARSRVAVEQTTGRPPPANGGGRVVEERGMQPGVSRPAARSVYLSDGCGCLGSFASGGRRVRRQSVPGPERSAARSHPVGMDAETPIKFGMQEDRGVGYTTG